MFVFCQRFGNITFYNSSWISNSSFTYFLVADLVLEVGEIYFFLDWSSFLVPPLCCYIVCVKLRQWDFWCFPTFTPMVMNYDPCVLQIFSQSSVLRLISRVFSISYAYVYVLMKNLKCSRTNFQWFPCRKRAFGRSKRWIFGNISRF